MWLLFNIFNTSPQNYKNQTHFYSRLQVLQAEDFAYKNWAPWQPVPGYPCSQSEAVTENDRSYSELRSPP